MKTTILIILTVLNLKVLATDTLSVDTIMPEIDFDTTMFELPKANQKVIDFVDKNMHKKVGEGICFNLVDGALSKVDRKWKDRADGKYVFGEEVERFEIMPGDIVMYRKAVCKKSNGDTSFVRSHVAVVYKIYDDGSYSVAEQNTKGALSKSIVVVTDGEELISGELRYFRPY